jgi:hypothetical protein
MLLPMPPKQPQKPKKGSKQRPPRICVPNSERALFAVESQKFVGVIQRLSLTGGSVILSKGPIPEGTLADMGLKTVFGPMRAQIQFLQRGADGIPLAQAFRFLDMDGVSRKRFEASIKKMQEAGFSDVPESNSLSDLAAQSLGKLGESIRRLSALVGSGER